MEIEVWQECVKLLQTECSVQQLRTWINPLKAEISNDSLHLIAPNRFILEWVNDKYLTKISNILHQMCGNKIVKVLLQENSIIQNTELQQQVISQQECVERAGVEIIVNTKDVKQKNNEDQNIKQDSIQELEKKNISENSPSMFGKIYNVNYGFVFDSFIEGKSNQLACAAAKQVAENPGRIYNPLFLYGGSGLGKTHLMHAIGNKILQRNSDVRIIYLHAERFVADMVRAIRTNKINEFKKIYRSLDVLLIDDIQFFAGKERSQEEFFYTFNTLLEGGQQVILTCDRYPKEIERLEERLCSRFGWGLTVSVEPPELDTRIAILLSKARALNVDLDYEIAFFIAKKVNSNVRELEGVLKRVLANAQFTGSDITIDFVRESLRDLFALQDKLITIENIQRTVADFFKIRATDITSKRRDRCIARPRQIAMALSKELTSNSLLEIGDAFGGRDHSTVLHACRSMELLRNADSEITEAFAKLLRILSS